MIMMTGGSEKYWNDMILKRDHLQVAMWKQLGDMSSQFICAVEKLMETKN